MANIFDMFNAKAIGSYWAEVNKTQVPFLGTGLFPARKQVGLDLSWVKGKGGLPVALKPSQFDAKATLRDRIGVARVETEMPFFREAMLIKEKDRQDLMAFEKNGDEYVKPMVQRIYDDIVTLVDGANVQAERMVMQLLATGGISIIANGVDYTYNYADEAWKAENITTLADNAKWSAKETANPIKDIKTAQMAVQAKTGVKPARAICNSTVWNDMLENAAIRAAINTGRGIVAEAEIFDADLQAYLLRNLNLTVVVYDNMFVNENKEMQKFFPDGVFTLIPATTLGNTWYGTTPEEADLMGGRTNADVSIVNTGVAITTIMQEHPVNKETIVSEIVLPSFERIDEMHILNV